MGAPTYYKVIDHEDVSIALADGTTPTAVSLALTLEKATLAVSGLQQGGISQEVVVNTRRGKNTSMHRAGRTQVTGSLTSNIQGIDSDEIHNFVLRRETYKTNASTLGVGQKVYTIDMLVTSLESNWGGTNKVVSLTDIHGTLDLAEQEDGPMILSYNFTGYGEVLVPDSDPIQTERA